MKAKTEKQVIKDGQKIAKRLTYIIEMTLKAFGIQAQVVEIYIEDKYIRFGLAIAMGTRISQVVSLRDDITLAIEAPSRVEIYPVLGRDIVEIKVPTDKAVLKKERFKIIRIIDDVPKIDDWTRTKQFVAKLLEAVDGVFYWLSSKI